MMTDDSDRDPIEALAEEFLERYRRGESPSLVEYAERYSQWSTEIRELFPTLLMMEQLASAETNSSPDSDSKPEFLPQVFGDYRILCVLGQGGMGIVYEAVHQSLDRHVALKVLPQSRLESEMHRERFRREAKAAAKLHHSNIVPVFDVGEVNGILFYAMQFIKGMSLDELVRRRRDASSRQGESRKVSDQVGLENREVQNDGHPSSSKPPLGPPNIQTRSNHLDSTAEDDIEKPKSIGDPSSPDSLSFELSSDNLAETQSASYFRAVAKIGLQVSQALSFVHQRGLLHRDIKPSNLLLDEQGRIWITDFGLAKSVGVDDLTRAGGVVGTLRYMAPERFRGESTASGDLYSIGATLYELATSQAIFVEQDRMQLMDQIANQTPISPRKIEPKIPVDLQTIILKCLEKDPERRYKSGNELAGDLRRWLNRVPIRARKISPLGHAVRWAQRNPVVASLLGTIALVTTVGFLLVAWQWRSSEWNRKQAERNLEKSQQVVRDFHLQVSEPWGSLHSESGSQHLRFDLLSKAKSYFEEFLNENESSGTRFQLAYANFCLGDLLNDMGQAEQAERRLQNAKSALEEIVAVSDDDEEARNVLALTYFELADIQFSSSNKAKALELLGKAEKHFRRLLDDFPETIRYETSMCSIFSMRGVTYHKMGNFEDAESAFLRAISLQRQIHKGSTGQRSRQPLAIALRSYGNLLKELERYELSIKSFQEALSLHEKVERESGELDWNQRSMSACCRTLGSTYRRLGNYSQSVEHYQKGLEVQRRLCARNPAIPEYRTELASFLNNLGNTLGEMESRVDARKVFNESLMVSEQLVKEFPNDVHYRAALANTLHNLGIDARYRGSHSEAIKKFGRATELLAEVSKVDHSVPDQVHRLARSQQEIAITYAQLNQFESACNGFEESIVLYEQLRSENPEVPEYRRGLAKSYTELALAVGRQYQLKNRNFPYQAVEVQRTHQLLRNAFEITQELVDQYPKVVRHQRDLATVLFDHAMIWNAGRDLKKATADCGLSISLLKKIVASGLARTSDLTTLATRLEFQAQLASQLRDQDRRIELLNQAIAVREKIVAKHPKSSQFLRDLATQQYRMANLVPVEDRQGRDRRDHLFRAAISSLRTIADENVQSKDLSMLALCHYQLAKLHQTHDIGQAIEDCERAMATQDQLMELDEASTHRFRMAMILTLAGAIYHEAGNIDQARSAYHRAFHLDRLLFQENPKYIVYGNAAASDSIALAGLAESQGELAESYQHLDTAEQWLEKVSKIVPKNATTQKHRQTIKEARIRLRLIVLNQFFLATTLLR